MRLKIQNTAKCFANEALAPAIGHRREACRGDGGDEQHAGRHDHPEEPASTDHGEQQPEEAKQGAAHIKALWGEE